MTIIQLEYFCAVCRNHTIKGAADELFVSSPTISVSLKELENELHLQLLHHDKNRISLTKEGETFYQKAENLLRMRDDMIDEFSKMAEDSHPLTIGIPPMISTVFFPRMIDAFHEKYDIPVRLFEYGSNRAQNLVNTSKLDTALVNMSFYSIDKFESHKLMDDSYALCVSRTHPLAHEKEVRLEQLADQELIFYNTDSVQNQTFMTRFYSLGIKPHILMHCSQLYTTLNFVRGGNCAAVLFSSLAINPRDFRMIPIVPAISNSFGIIWKKGVYTPLRTSRFIEFAKKYEINR